MPGLNIRPVHYLEQHKWLTIKSRFYMENDTFVLKDSTKNT
jgi:hypothetical protein